MANTTVSEAIKTFRANLKLLQERAERLPGGGEPLSMRDHVQSLTTVLDWLAVLSEGMDDLRGRLGQLEADVTDLQVPDMKARILQLEQEVFYLKANE